MAAAVLVSLAACDAGPSEPAAPIAARLEAAIEVQQAATVGSAAASAPAVRAVTASGAPVPSVAVTFVVSGGGSLGRTSATTGADGVASAGSWTLGKALGTQTVTAQAAGMAPVVFTATARAGAPAQLTVTSGNDQAAPTGAAVPVRPAVLVRDDAGNPVAGAEVLFEVESGGGTVTGTAVTTDAGGTATVGAWTLGVEPGVQRLRARVGTLSASISARASLPVGCALAPYAIGATITGTWETEDCRSAGQRDSQDPAGAVYDRYELTLTEQRIFRVELTGPNSRTFRIRRKSGEYVALQTGTAFTSPTSNPMVLKYALEPGSYVLEAQAPDAGVTGAYTLRTVIDSGITCRPIVFGTVGVTVAGTIDPATDCRSPGAGVWYEDWLVMILKTGDRLRLTMTTTDMAPLLVWRDDRMGPLSPTLKTARLDRPGTVVIEWTATFDGFHEAVITRAGAATPWGAYTLKVERLP